VFGISAIIEPYVINATGIAAKDSRYIAIDAKALLALMEMDYQMGYILCGILPKQRWNIWWLHVSNWLLPGLE